MRPTALVPLMEVECAELDVYGSPLTNGLKEGKLAVFPSPHGQPQIWGKDVMGHVGWASASNMETMAMHVLVPRWLVMVQTQLEAEQEDHTQLMIEHATED